MSLTICVKKYTLLFFGKQFQHNELECLLAYSDTKMTGEQGLEKMGFV